MTKDEMRTAAEELRKLVGAIKRGELTASATARARLEGAAIALALVADGRVPTPDDLADDAS